MDHLLLASSFFTVAVLYASAGFGGGSSYLALLSLTGLAPSAIRPIALLCNLAVTGQGSVAFGRAGITPWRRAFPLVLASVPAAFLGGRVQLPREQYLLLLGALLVLAALLMLVRFGGVAGAISSGGTYASKSSSRMMLAPVATSINLLVGALVGFVSGVVGIGGGIFLSPLLFLTRWDTTRAIAATTSLFIALNSFSGLVGQVSIGLPIDWSLAGLLLVAVVAGGYLGTRLNLRWWSPVTIQKIAAGLILLVGVRLLYANWPSQLAL